MIDPNAFTKLMPGLDFMRNLMQGAGQAMPTMGQWVAPTLDPAEIEKRINDLKAVHYWLEQNARMLGVTIQALEVQRMTLSTLQTMNLPMASLREAMTLPQTPAAPASRAAPDDDRASADVGEKAAPPAPPAPAPTPRPAAESEAAAAKPAADPMLWWGALTKQFAELATKAMQDSSAGLARNLAAGDTTRDAAAAQAAGAAPNKATKTATKKTAKKTEKNAADKTAAEPPRSDG